MKHKLITIVLALHFISSLIFAQVDKLTDTVTNDATMARLRLAHFVFGGPNVDWLVNGEIAVNGGQEQVNIPVGYINGYLYLEPGTYSFSVVPTGKTTADALLETDVAVKAGHRYTLAMIGQLEDEKLSPLVIDETVELQKLGAAKDQQVYFVVNNIAGAETLDLDEDGHGPKSVSYGGFGVAPVPAGKYKHAAITANGDPNAVIDSGDYGGYGERPGADALMGFFGHFPGTLGEDFDYSNASPNSDLNTLEFLQGFSGVGFEEDYQVISFDTFLKAVEIAGLTDLLTTADPLLVLPPTDLAFAELPKEQLDALMADPEALADLLRNHIAEAYVPKGALATTPGGPFDRSFTNLLGGTTHIGDGYTVNGLNVGDTSSTFTVNGTQVHPITKVLLPDSQIAPVSTIQEENGFEVNVDRPGQDYSDFDLEINDPGQCYQACQDDGQCKAWTYVKPDVQGPNARCWLKWSIPDKVTDECCVSGINLTLIDNSSRANEDTLTLRLAVADGEDAPSEAYVKEFVAQVNARSDGTIIVKPVFRAGDDTVDGFEKGVIQVVGAGKYELGLAAARSWDTESIMSFQTLQAPFLITNDALAEAVATSDSAARMLESLSSVGFIGLTLWPEDLRHPFAIPPQEPLLSPENFAGLNIRTTPSDLSYALIDALGGTPVFPDDYQGAESGLRQGFSLTGTPIATGNVVFFPKYQVLFANAAAFASLTDEERSVLREAASATQEKAIAEHPREVDAASAWCADGGTVVMASDEQIASFETAAQPVFDQLEQDPMNAELIAAIRDLKAKTPASPGAEACSPELAATSPTPDAETQVWKQGLPPNGTWQVELTTDDFVRMGLLRSVARDEWAGVYTLTYQDGTARFDWQGEQGKTGNCEFTYREVDDFVRFTSLSAVDCGHEVDDMRWRLDADGNLYLLVNDVQNARLIEAKAMYEAKPWQKIE